MVSRFGIGEKYSRCFDRKCPCFHKICSRFSLQFWLAPPTNPNPADATGFKCFQWKWFRCSSIAFVAVGSLGASRNMLEKQRAQISEMCRYFFIVDFHRSFYMELSYFRCFVFCGVCAFIVVEHLKPWAVHVCEYDAGFQQSQSFKLHKLSTETLDPFYSV